MSEGKHLVGVDIGSSSIKVCQVKQGRKGVVVNRLGYVPMPAQTIVDGQVMDAATVVDALTRVVQEARITQKEVAVSVSGQNVIIRKITVPMMTAAELEEQIQWEAEQHIPFDIKDVHVDYQVLQRKPDVSQMELLLVAAKKEQINDYIQLARDARLRPMVCDIDAFTVQNVFEVHRGIPDNETLALVNIGASHASLNVVANGVSVFTREVGTGGNLATSEIQKRLGIPFEQAEAYKCGGGGIVPAEASQVVEEVVDTIAAEVQRSVDFFMATSGEASINQIILSGGSSQLPGLAEAISGRSRIGTELWSPAQDAKFDSSLDEALIRERGAQLAVCLGLALRREKEVRAS